MGDTCWSKIGVVTEDQHLTIEAIEGHHVVSERLVELKEIWQSTLREL